MLSQCIVVGPSSNIPKSENRFVIHTTSAVSAARLLYSTSTELLEMVLYFLGFQAIKEPPNFNKYPVTDLLVLGYEAQSATQ